MTKLVNEQARMTIGSNETLAHASRIRNLNERVDYLSALTRLAGENHVWLSNKAKKLSNSLL